MLLGKRRKESRSSAEHPSIVRGCTIEGSVSTVVLDKGTEKAQQTHAPPGCPVLLRLLIRSSFGGVAGGVPSRSAWLIESIPCLSFEPCLVTLEFTF